MMRHQQHFPWSEQGFESLISTLPREILETRAFIAPYLYSLHVQNDAQRFTEVATTRLPGVGIGTQAVVDMNGAQDTVVTVAQNGVRSMQQHRGIQSSAEGHREPAVGIKPVQLVFQGLDSEGHGVRQALRSS
jgi:hypothetical protein